MYSAVKAFEDILDKVYESPHASYKEIGHLLMSEDPAEIEQLLSFADKVRDRFVGGGILLRGIIEFSNHCANSCFYCGLNRQNTRLRRYRMSADEILACAGSVDASNIKTVVLQSGEDEELEPLWLSDVIKKIKRRFDMAVTLSVGERSRDDYALWRASGADRYLLKIETTDPGVYAAAHKDRRLESRLKCLDDLADLGYQTGSGILIGLPGQTIDSIARDILFFREKNFDMIGIGPFIPHADSRFNGQRRGDVSLVLKAIALARIVTRNTHIPATTALGSLGKDHRPDGLRCGANVLMPNFTPQPYRKLYELYPGKRCVDEPVGACNFCIESMAKGLGRFIDHGMGDGLKERMPVLNV